MKKIIIIIIILAVVGGLGYRIYTASTVKKTETRGGSNRGMDRAVPVTFVELEKTTLAQKLDISAELEPITLAEISAKVSGVIENINVSLGDSVKKGQLIIKLDDDEYKENLKNSEIAYKVAAASVERQQIETSNLKQNYDRSKELFSNRLISQETLEAAETRYKTAFASLNYYNSQLLQELNKIEQAKLRLSYTSIVAPFDGYIEKIMVERGTLVSSGRAILTIVDISKIKTTINIPENVFSSIKIGYPAFIRIQNQNNEFNGAITNIAPVIDISSKTGRAEITIDNPSKILKPGMTAMVRVILKTFKNINTVPAEAIYKTIQDYGIFIINDDETVKFVKTNIAVSDEGKTGIITEEEVPEKSKVVLLGGHLLKSGDKVVYNNGNDKQSEKRKKVSN